MTLEIVGGHIALSLTLFLTLSWIGRHSLSSGYVTLSAFVQRDEAPAFNLIFRILGPIVFILLAASFLYAMNLDRFVTEIWLVILYYYCGRLFFIFSLSRSRLINWRREGFLWIASIGLGWVIYDQIIHDRSILLPDIKDLKNQFWLLLILFLYTAFNNIRIGQDGTQKRKADYLKNAYLRSKNLYGEAISALSVDALSESLIYATLLFEQFNRPTAIRFVEHLVFPRGSKSLGPMQVTTDRRLTDMESVRLGAQHVVDLYRNAIEVGAQKAVAKGKTFDPLLNRYHRQFVLYKVASEYNKDDEYLSGIQEMHDQVVDCLYPALLFPPHPHWTESLV